MLRLHITSLCGKGQLALGSRDRREGAKKCCAEKLTAQQVQRVFYDVHIKCEDRYFWCSAGLESSLASMGRNSHTLFQKSSCWVQTLLHPMDHTGLTSPLAFLMCDITHKISNTGWGSSQHLLAQFGLGEVGCCRCLDLGFTETDSVLPEVSGLTFRSEEFLFEDLHGALSNLWPSSTSVDDY